MKNNLISFIFLFVLCFSFISADTLKQNTDYNFSITSNFATTCTLTTIDSPNSTIIINQDGTIISPNTFYFSILGGNYSVLGTYYNNIVCSDSTNTVTNSKIITITPTGEEISSKVIVLKIIFILFFITLIALIYNYKRNYDLKKAEDKLYSQYEHKNWIKLIFGLLSFNLLKNPFIIYYLLSFPIMIILNDFVISFGIFSLSTLFSTLLLIYTLGILVVGLLFFSYIQEWIVGAYEKVTDMDWGVGK